MSVSFSFLFACVWFYWLVYKIPCYFHHRQYLWSGRITWCNLNVIKKKESKKKRNRKISWSCGGITLPTVQTKKNMANWHKAKNQSFFLFLFILFLNDQVCWFHGVVKLRSQVYTCKLLSNDYLWRLVIIHVEVHYAFVHSSNIEEKSISTSIIDYKITIAD